MVNSSKSLVRNDMKNYSATCVLYEILKVKFQQTKEWVNLSYVISNKPKSNKIIK